MKQVLCLVALVALATTGCAGNRMLGSHGCDDVCCDPCCGNGGEACYGADGCSNDGCSNGGNGGMCGPGGPCGNGGVCGDCRGFAHALSSGFCPHSGGYPEMTTFNPGPPTGQVAYPYYTVRGPRDFLRNNPPSIGPY
jgi:hypothetical protein